MQNKPKPRLFFTDPLKTLWMMKEFKVEFELGNGAFRKYCVEDSSLVSIREFINNCQDYGQDFGKFYVVRESEEIFLPKLNDAGITANGDTCHFDGEQWLVDAGKRYVVAEGVDIIFRGKQFFQALQE